MHFFVFLVFAFAVGHEGLHVHGREHLQVMGADQAVFAYKGEEAILNCSLDGRVPASKIEEVSWKRTDGDRNVLVLLYQNNVTIPESSHESYWDRVELFSSEISKGNFSLKLMDVQMEDKGEFICEVHAMNTSARTTVVLAGVGFTAPHVSILVLSAIALSLAVGFCARVLNLLRKKDTSTTGMKTDVFLILCPNICMFVAFCLWSTEGFASEVIACSAVSILRPVMLLKTSPYLDKLPNESLQKAVKALAVPFYHSTITMAVCSVFFEKIAGIQRPAGHSVTVLIVFAVVTFISAVVLAVYGLRVHLTVCLEIFNGVLFGLLLSKNRDPYVSISELICVLAPPAVVMMMVLSLQRHVFEGKPFGVEIALSSIIVTIYSLGVISIFILFAYTFQEFVKRGWMILFEGVMFIFVWLVLICLLRCYQRPRQERSSHWRKKGYLFCGVIVAFLITVHGIVYFSCIYIMTEHKERAGYLALTPLIHVLAAACLFKHPKRLPGYFQTMVYMFGAVGLSTVNAIALTTELILKAGNGARTIGDLRVIVLSLETVFISAWLALQTYNAWMRLRDRRF
ncbi:uncharacterized protein LOC108263096 isoform X1 [Ictalurus punctatus]|uniref:Uncharacterized protein LOC108263096 isoform X1 n=2 Tax=Ictalurus punctatus TaxID=7998 RepID=A0A2D0QL84_ICTPU|nr:uncharacterized protein LOC108263096 isoform X1 [Ictalurus punctatus]XP_047010388.1 uncharacterized protein LOC108263096 isoform X1 [Ictalurus punctatus]XP_047010389.1 uncharacterized protein LOC108263096 isoform X1 [Ictalurus punctatus]XP_053535346.1 uncharacterized protein LOC108263096 isoform X1 [Ictalurus punctatus]